MNDGQYTAKTAVTTLTAQSDKLKMEARRTHE